MIALDTTYVEFNGIEDSCMPKQKGPVLDTITIDGKQATTIQGARRILATRAKQMGHPRDYSRDTVYRLLIDHRIKAVRTPSANYYFVDDLERVPLHPHRGKPPERKNYPPEIKEHARQLRREGLTQRAIAEQLEVSFQTVAYWTRKETPNP